MVCKFKHFRFQSHNSVQQLTELVRVRLEQVGFSGKTPIWNAALKDANGARSLIEKPDMIKGISKSNQKKAEELINQAKVRWLQNDIPKMSQSTLFEYYRTTTHTTIILISYVSVYHR